MDHNITLQAEMSFFSDVDLSLGLYSFARESSFPSIVFLLDLVQPGVDASGSVGQIWWWFSLRPRTFDMSS